MGPFSVQQTRDGIEKAREPQVLGDCGSSIGLSGLVSTIVNPRPPSPQGEQGLYLGALAYLQGCCYAFLDPLPEPILALNKGSKQGKQSITTHTWPLHAEPLQLGRPVPWMP